MLEIIYCRTFWLSVTPKNPGTVTALRVPVRGFVLFLFFFVFFMLL